jgi:hypothetical protein
MRRVILPLMLLTVACRTAPVELTPEQKTEVTDDFRQFRLGLYASDEALDPEPMLSSVAQDAALVIQGMELSYEEFATAMRTGFAGLRSASIDVREMRIDALAADAVANTDVIAETVTDDAGNRAERFYLHTEVWVRRAGRWVMIHSQMSNPPA